jgi:hypothetical protein
MIRIMAIAFLAAGILAACDDGPAGPTAQGGEVALELFKHKDNVYRSTGEGYDFATCAKVEITMVQAQAGIGTITDLDSFPEMMWAPIPGYTMWATPNRIYQPGYQGSYLHLDFKEKAEFELVTLDGKTRYKIFAEHREIGFDEERNGMVSEFVIRYKLLST